ncbi:hypothetical protein [Nocardia noduli]|uniref:hypothetical protein n=1 Tax=Nocardia noduli TaxID=2815722 RepID=UPI001C24CE26|nr:hypothetical protein [Nocardia noduli]
MNKERLSREKFALIIGDGRVCAVAEIRGVSVHEDRVALDGEALTEGHPVRDAWIGKPDPVVNASQNPVGYCDLPEEAEFRERPCGCGCGEISTRDFLPGHDVRAFQDRVRRMFAGSALEFIRWVDRMAGDCGLPVLAGHSQPAGDVASPDDRRGRPSLGSPSVALFDSEDSLPGKESHAGSG